MIKRCSTSASEYDGSIAKLKRVLELEQSISRRSSRWHGLLSVREITCRDR